MKYIADLVLDVEDEINGAKEYAEKYLYNKSHGNINRAKVYYDQSQDELKHAKFAHDVIIEEIEKLNSVYKPTEEMKEIWEKSHNNYVERVAWIRQMLAM